jgi:hypothetical protein
MADVSSRGRKRGDELRRAGLRPVQIWVPDTRRPGFTAECRRQCRLVANADQADGALHRFMDEVLVDV